MNKEKILGLMRKSAIGNRWCYSIDNCIEKINGYGQVNVAIVYDNDEDGAKERCYKEFMSNYDGGRIRKDFI